MTKQGHPLPGSDEARHDEIPEHLEREKGRGDDAKAVVQSDGEAVNPDGEPYRYDPGRGAGEEANMEDPMADDNSTGRSVDSQQGISEFASDQAQHQDRGQSVADKESDES